MNYFTGYYSYQTASNFGFWGKFTFQIPNYFIQAISTVVILINAISINTIFNRNEFLGRNSFMPSLLYVLLMSFYHSFYKIDGLLIAHSFIIATLFLLYKLRQNEDARKLSFNIGFFAGIATTVHPPLIFIFPFLYVMSWFIRPFIIREMILILIGFSTPLIYAFLYLFHNHIDIDYQIIKSSSDYTRHQFDFLVSSSIFALSLLLSMISIRSGINKKSLRLKKMVNMLWVLIVMGLGMGIMDYVSFNQIERFSIIMVPLSLLLTFSFIHKTLYYIANGLFYIILLYSFVKFYII